MNQKASPTRSYNGVPQEERRADRRARLIAAAVNVYGERGYRQASVKTVCEAAGLTERYFYESFPGSEALLVACYNAVTERLLKDIVQAGKMPNTDRSQRAEAMLRAYFTAIRRDPISARVFLVEIRGASSLVDAVFDAALRQIAEETLRVLGALDAPANRLLALGVVGGISQMALHWATLDYAAPIDDMVATALQLARALLD